jgi:hypothetical protein
MAVADLALATPTYAMAIAFRDSPKRIPLMSIVEPGLNAITQVAR